MPRPGYVSITITRDVYEIINELKRKYNVTTIDLIKNSLLLYDKFNELLNIVEAKI
mgnify:CR=1 FL=1